MRRIASGIVRQPPDAAYRLMQHRHRVFQSAGAVFYHRRHLRTLFHQLGIFWVMRLSSSTARVRLESPSACSSVEWLIWAINWVTFSPVPQYLPSSVRLRVPAANRIAPYQHWHRSACEYRWRHWRCGWLNDALPLPPLQNLCLVRRLVPLPPPHSGPEYWSETQYR